jgi:hypothetical protein
LFRKLLKKQARAPRVLITDKLKSYAAAKNSHQPTRRRERIMKRFKSPRQVQQFLSTHDQIANVFTRRPNQDTAAKFHSARNQAFTNWVEVTGVLMAASSCLPAALFSTDSVFRQPTSDNLTVPPRCALAAALQTQPARPAGDVPDTRHRVQS